VRRALIFTHVAHEGPGRVLDALERAGVAHEIRRLDAGDDVPASLDPYDLLVTMGGPMGVSDVGSSEYPFLLPELELMKSAVRRRFPVLGLCLGAQLLAAAAGARVYPNLVGEPAQRIREIGWGAVHFVRGAEEEPVLEGLDPAELVLHWHGDTFDLPDGATRLASSLACENQMFRVGARQFGLQFHVEIRAEDVPRWLAEGSDYVRESLGEEGGARILRDTAQFLPRASTRGDRLLDNLVRALLA
jgi:GMP synthase-like glutamine amidotransferase